MTGRGAHRVPTATLSGSFGAFAHRLMEKRKQIHTMYGRTCVCAVGRNATFSCLSLPLQRSYEFVLGYPLAV